MKGSRPAESHRTFSPGRLRRAHRRTSSTPPAMTPGVEGQVLELPPLRTMPPLKDVVDLEPNVNPMETTKGTEPIMGSMPARTFEAGPTTNSKTTQWKE